MKTNKKTGWLVYLSMTNLVLAKLKCYGVLWHASSELVNWCKFLLLEPQCALLLREDPFSSLKQGSMFLMHFYDVCNCVAGS